MRRLSLLIGVSLLTLPLHGMAAPAAPTTSLFDVFYQQASGVLGNDPAPKPVVNFVIQEMRRWQGNGIALTADDVRYAETDDIDHLCAYKQDIFGKPLNFELGEGESSCLGLQRAILFLIDGERDAQELGNDLLMAANGAELSVSDEAHRLTSVSSTSMSFRRLWTGTGSQYLPWPVAAKSAVQALDAALSSEAADIDTVVERYHFGYFRDKREADVSRRTCGQNKDCGKQTGAALAQIAQLLNITGDPKATAEYVTPGLRAENIALWVRGDDVGISWINPTHLPRPSIVRGGAYPVFAKNGDALAYPFDYHGTLVPAAKSLYVSPLCSRLMGRFGYLCQSPKAKTTCATGSRNAITLTQCDEKKSETLSGPPDCTIETPLFKDSNAPVNTLDPKKDRIATNVVCSPQSRVLYSDEIAQHACYISRCMVQSLSGHTLFPMRNPAYAFEMASPVLGYQKPDPQLGLYDEMSGDYAQISLPPYLIDSLVTDFDRQYCEQSGQPPNALAGLCTYREQSRTSLPLGSFNLTFQSTYGDEADLTTDQRTNSIIAMAAGWRFGLDQSLPVQRKMVSSLAQVVQNIANLFLELKNAPVTREMCPWIGPPPAK